jgi:XTP/dITP diphosphohydrolase
MRLCFATNNRHKLLEVTAVLGDSIDLLTLQDIGCTEELPETHRTIAANASQKAWYVWDHFKIPCFADDSGLEVTALNGEPGVDSAHYAGLHRSHYDNIELLLKNLHRITDRSAQFRTVISLILPQGEMLFEGIVRGKILEMRRGEGGFGYDPVFLPDGSGKSLAEMTMEEKNRISHRAKAVQKLAAFLSTQEGKV